MSRFVRVTWILCSPGEIPTSAKIGQIWGTLQRHPGPFETIRTIGLTVPECAC